MAWSSDEEKSRGEVRSNLSSLDSFERRCSGVGCVQPRPKATPLPENLRTIISGCGFLPRQDLCFSFHGTRTRVRGGILGRAGE